VLASELKILNEAAQTPPFHDRGATVDVSENIRLKHRHLDLRRPLIQKNIMARHKAAAAVRAYLNDWAFSTSRPLF
jgi:aspartyl-tRNA synthetase